MCEEQRGHISSSIITVLLRDLCYDCSAFPAPYLTSVNTGFLLAEDTRDRGRQHPKTDNMCCGGGKSENKLFLGFAQKLSQYYW